MVARKWMRVVATLVVFWLMVILYMAISVIQSPEGETEFKLKLALEQLDKIKVQNEELKQMVDNIRKIRLDASKNDESNHKKLGDTSLLNLPQKTQVAHSSAEHEKFQRRVENGVRELWFYLSGKLKHLKTLSSGNADLANALDVVIEDGGAQQRSILSDILQLHQTEGSWRIQEAKSLSDLVQRRLHYLQNPKDCSTAKKVICNLNKGCGYGCQIHHVVYCFVIAYGTGRTLILQSKGWRYNPDGWERVFMPLSQTCLDSSGSSSRNWGAQELIKDAQVVTLPIVDSLRPRPPYMPLAIPEDLAPRLTRFHGDPPVWWMGQFLKYMLRPQSSLQMKIDEATKKLAYKSPIVGVHVRRTDKVGTEAAFHGIDEYMTYVEEYYDVLERSQTVDKRRVFLASDDPSVLKDARKGYPNYEFVSDPQISQSAGLGTRYSDSSLIGVILDIHFLSRSNYLVCTFSSQVCRLAYEMMQTLHADASAFFHSLDDIYYFGGQNGHHETAIYKHKPRSSNEIALNPGDDVGIAGNHWDGYSKGMNLAQGGRSGLYPSYKTVDKLRIVKMPTYPEADVQS